MENNTAGQRTQNFPPYKCYKRPSSSKAFSLTPLNLKQLKRELEQDLLTAQTENESTTSELESLPLKRIDENCTTEKNDSFDLNFSSLNINTPIKKEPVKDNDFITPKVTSNDHKFITPQPHFLSLKKGVRKSPKKIIFNSCQKISSRNLYTAPLSHVRLPLIKEIDKFTDKENIVENKQTRIYVNGNEYLLKGCLGRGGSSEVFQALNVKEQIDVAIKCVNLSNPASSTGYINEVKVLHQLQSCDKIIKMFEYEIINSEKKLLMVLERGGKDLATILKNFALKSTHTPMHTILFYWMEMLYCVQQIHLNGIIHSDLKPANFLKSDDGGLKLIDFGIASCVDSDHTSVFKTNQEGSCNYISPEALNQETSTNCDSPSYGISKFKISYKSDVWSLGCILYQLVYNKTPFQHIKPIYAKLMAISTSSFKIDYPEANWVSPKLIKTIQQCLQYNKKLRPSVQELINEYEILLKNI